MLSKFRLSDKTFCQNRVEKEKMPEISFAQHVRWQWNEMNELVCYLNIVNVICER